MDKPIVTPFQSIPSSDIQPYKRYLPTAFDESLTLLEKINMVINYLNSVSDVLNGVGTQWNDIIEWVMSDGLNQGVIDQLLKWKDDGTLDTLINTAIMTGKLDANAFYDEVTVEAARDDTSNTNYFIIKIPKYDKNHNLIKLKQGFNKNDYANTDFETPRDFALRNGATYVSNCSTFSDTTRAIVGTVIKDGVVLQDNYATDIYNYILAWDDENNLKVFDPNTSAQTILNQGYTNACSSFIPLVQDHVSVSDTVINTRSVFSEIHPRQAIAQDDAGNLYFFTSHGRRMYEHGMTAKDVIRIFIARGYKTGFMLDGGGSAQSIYYGSLLNKVTDDGGHSERPMRNFLYVGKDMPTRSINEALTGISQITKALDYKIADLEALKYTAPATNFDQYLINGWENFGTQGSSVVRGWMLPNNLLYLVGTIKPGATTDVNTPFMQLPPELHPMFTTSHLTCGDERNEIYKIIMGSDGVCQAYYWSQNADNVGGESGNPDYIKLDGIIIPINVPII